MEKEAIENAAWEVSSWIQDAVSDIAYNPDCDESADDLYNDPDTLSDLTGDRIHDSAEGKDLKERYKNMILIAEAMKDGGHGALTIALNEHIKSWKAFLKKA